MNSPRNPSQIPAPDPAVIAHYVTHVLGLPLADWQRKALTDAIQGFGYASVAWADQLEDAEPEPSSRVMPRAEFEGRRVPPGSSQQQSAEVAKGYNAGPAPQHAAQSTGPRRSDTPIGDDVRATDPRSS